MRSPILDNNIENRYVLGNLIDSFKKGSDVRVAKVTIPYYTSKITGDSWEDVETTRELRELNGYQFVASNGLQRLYVVDPRQDYNYQEVDAFHPEVKVLVGNFLNRSGFDPYYKRETQRTSPEPDVKVEHNFENLVLLTPLRRELDTLMVKLNQDYGLPSTLKLATGMENDKVYERVITELTQLSSLYDRQSSFASVNNIKPEFKGEALDMSSDEYRELKRSLAKNIAMSATNGVLLSIDAGPDSLTLRAQTARGKEVFRIELDETLLSTHTEHWEQGLATTSEAIEMRVIMMPEAKNVKITGSSIEEGAALLNSARDLRVIISDSVPNEHFTKKDIENAIRQVKQDLDNDGFNSVSVGLGNEDIVNAKFTMMLNAALNGAVRSIAPEYISKRENEGVGLGM